eukprot:10625268-Heterocapsa_arctica.AAC.1
MQPWRQAAERGRHSSLPEKRPPPGCSFESRPHHPCWGRVVQLLTLARSLARPESLPDSVVPA